MNQATGTRAAPEAKTPQETAPARKASEEIAKAEPTFDQIRQRAYEIYIARGDEPGSDLQDWLEAERALRSKP